MNPDRCDFKVKKCEMAELCYIQLHCKDLTRRDNFDGEGSRLDTI